MRLDVDSPRPSQAMAEWMEPHAVTILEPYVTAAIAATYLALLTRALVPAASPLHARRPLGCNLCMAGWCGLLVAWVYWRPMGWDDATRFPVHWWAVAGIAYGVLELFEHRAPPAPPSSLLPPEPPQQGPYS